MTSKIDFAAFVLSHGRPDNVRTVDSLRRRGYTGPIYIVIDDADETRAQYKANFDNVVLFNKQEIAERTQLADNFHDRTGVVIFARNACFDIAERLGIRAFVQLDDDYVDWRHRFTSANEFISRPIADLDTVFAAMLRFLESTSFLTFAMAQPGDMFANYTKSIRMFRKAMNTFVCLTERRFAFTGRVNEDVNTYVALGQQGHLFGTINAVAMYPVLTQTQEGGMTGLYQKHGTYSKSFYTVIYAPASVRVEMMKSSHPRIHHRINWNATVPKIVPESARKPR